jgi:tRNA modification GTPase
MSASAALITGRETAAIATIKLFGDASQSMLTQIFEPSGGGPLELMPGRILLGRIVDGGTLIDQVTIGCEGPCDFAIHCHGNPLIVERIMKLLRQHGVTLCDSKDLLARALHLEDPTDPIPVEAKLALTAVKTLAGAKLIAQQVDAGLSQAAPRWLAEIETVPPDAVKDEVTAVLEHGEIARLLIDGVTVVLAGPPNTGKSTLLNALSGREKALVSDIAGTTRDWVSAEVHLPPLAVTLIDTAGLDLTMPTPDELDAAAQRVSIALLDRADVVLLVLDGSEPVPPLDPAWLERLATKRTVLVLNKTDLPQRCDKTTLPLPGASAVRISAKNETGLEALADAVHYVCRLNELPPDAPVAFTDRQRRLLGQMQRAANKKDAIAALRELLQGRIRL